LGRNPKVHTEAETAKNQIGQTRRAAEKDLEWDSVRAAYWLPVEDAPTRVLCGQHNASVFPAVGQARGIPQDVGTLLAGI
jgi:hypothetical protein